MEIDSSAIFHRLLKRWSGIFITAMLGALVGLLMSWVQRPLYQAEAVLAVAINYGVTEPLELIVEDRAINRVLTFVKGDDVIHAVLDRLPNELRESRNWQDPPDLNAVIHLDQRLAEWGFIAIDPDPQVATQVAQTWAEVALEVLDEATIHAWRAAALMDEPFDVTCSLVDSPDPENPNRMWQCQVSTWEVDPEVLDGTFQTELIRSHGVLPNFSYELIRAADLPQNPVLWRRGLLIAAGGLAGLIAGVVVALVFPSKSRS